MSFRDRGAGHVSLIINGPSPLWRALLPSGLKDRVGFRYGAVGRALAESDDLPLSPARLFE